MITLPHNYSPRSYQLPVLRALDSGAKRVVAVWHRRSGKDKTFINYCAAASADRIGAYYYLFPTYGQAKRVIWDGRDKDGNRFVDHFPKEYIKKKLEDEMKIEFINGSSFQLLGTENIDSIVGSNPLGCVFSEYSLQDPKAWDYIRPILRENDGWAVFNFTPRGKNHGRKMYDMAMKLMQEGDPRWFCQKLSITDTGVLTEADIADERREGMSEEMIEQEYYCSFEGVMQGSIFGKQLAQADKEGRVCNVPWQPDMPVSTWWDIGTGDPTAIWFTQDSGREIHVVDYYENSGVGLGVDHYVKHLQELKEKRGWIWGAHNAPHDAEGHEFAAGGKSAKEVAGGMGFKFNIIPRCQNKTDSIAAGRSIMSRCWFDRARTERGRDALQNYHYAWDEKRKVFRDLPHHDWSSNAADAWQQLGMGHKFTPTKRERISPRSGGASGWQAS